MADFEDSEHPDPHAEIEAMKEIADAMNKLQAASQDRVLDWANRFYKKRPASPSIWSSSFSPSPSSTASPSEPPIEIATLFASANPGTEAEKALVGAYWLRQEGFEEFDSFRLNSELTHLGHRVGNITRALSTLMSSRPALIVQTRKEGKTKQARKRYKLTVEGIKRVERMLSGENPSDN